jgi:hypothetical protein
MEDAPSSSKNKEITMTKILTIWLLISGIVWAAGNGASKYGEPWNPDFETPFVCDSVVIKAGYPDLSNLYVSGKMTPRNTDSLVWDYTRAGGLDSIGAHKLDIIYHRGAAVYHAGGTWYNDMSVSSRLAPTVLGRSLDVRTTGEAGVDFSNVYGSLTRAAMLPIDTLFVFAGLSTDHKYFTDYGLNADSVVVKTAAGVAVYKRVYFHPGAAEAGSPPDSTKNFLQ